MTFQHEDGSLSKTQYLLPWARRFLLARDHELCRGVLRVFLETVFSWYRARLGLAEGQTGAIAVIQRFSSSLALNYE